MHGVIAKVAGRVSGSERGDDIWGGRFCLSEARPIRNLALKWHCAKGKVVKVAWPTHGRRVKALKSLSRCI